MFQRFQYRKSFKDLIPKDMYNNQYHMDAYPTQQGNISETNFIREHQRQQHHNSTQEYLTKQNKHAIQKAPPSYPSPEPSFVHQVNVPVAIVSTSFYFYKQKNVLLISKMTCNICYLFYWYVLKVISAIILQQQHNFY